MTLHALSACDLRAGLERGDFSSVEVVEALHARADALERSVGGFTERPREASVREARRRDEERRRGAVRGPLHGLPVTVKDNVDVAGLPSTLGLRARAAARAERDAAIVRLLREAGAVILGKSNVPQALIPMRCANAVYGETRNPWDLSRATGGSSGGEAALLASGQSALGVGTDLGGSIRFPAAFCGVAGVKPTPNRWSNLGANTVLAGQEIVRSQTGPMARSAADLALFMGALDVALQARIDPAAPPLALGDADAVDVSRLRIGWYDHDGFVPADPACRRAVREAVRALAAAGAETVEAPPPDQREAVMLYVAAVGADGTETLRAALAGEPPEPAIRAMLGVGRAPAAARPAAARLLRALGEGRIADAFEAGGRRSVRELWRLAARRSALAASEWARWADAGLDAVLCPAGAGPAPQADAPGELSLTFSYYGRYNLVGAPAGVVPATRVRPEEAAAPGGADRVERALARARRGSEGLPVGVQVVARPWREDVLLAVMGAVERAARRSAGFPITPVGPAGRAGG